MRKGVTAILIVFCLVFAGTAVAESGGGKADRKVARLQAKLNLTDEQANKIATIFGENFRNKPACKELTEFTERQSCRTKQREAVRAEVTKVLTAEQQQQFAALKDKKGCRHGRRHGGRSERNGAKS